MRTKKQTAADLKKEADDYAALLERTIHQHAPFRVIAHCEKATRKDFNRIKKLDFSEWGFSMLAEWSASWMNQGDLNIVLKSTRDKKCWEMVMDRLRGRVYAVAEVTGEGEIVMEKMAAALMSCYTRMEGNYIDVINTSGEEDYSLLMDLYEYLCEEHEVVETPDPD